MSVRLRVFYPDLQRLFEDQGEVSVHGATVGECLEDLFERYSEARDLLFNKHGVLRRHVYVFVNHEGLFKAEMSKPVRDQDQLIIAVLASGG